MKISHFRIFMLTLVLRKLLNYIFTGYAMLAGRVPANATVYGCITSSSCLLCLLSFPFYQSA